MALPDPKPGLVISYNYLWRYEYETEQEEGRKYRPSAIVLSVGKQGGEVQATVAPITHQSPNDPQIAIEIPMQVQEHLRLNGESLWLIVNEINQFTWPGYDLRSLYGRKGKYDYGFIPPKLFEEIKQKVLDLIIDH